MFGGLPIPCSIVLSVIEWNHICYIINQPVLVPYLCHFALRLAVSSKYKWLVSIEPAVLLLSLLIWTCHLLLACLRPLEKISGCLICSKLSLYCSVYWDLFLFFCFCTWYIDIWHSLRSLRDNNKRIAFAHNYLLPFT